MERETLRKAGGPRKTVPDEDPESLLEQGIRGRVLDVATGGGAFVRFLRYYARPGTVVVGVEPSDEAIRAAAGAFQDQGVLLARARGEGLCFSDQAFDAVSVSNSVHHFSHPWTVLEEMLRVLRPGGLFVLREMFREGGRTRAQRTHIRFHHWRASVDRSLGVYHGPTLALSELLAIPGRLGLAGVRCGVRRDMEHDPRNPVVLQSVERTLEDTLARIPDPDPAGLRARGETLRGLLRRTGVSGADSVLMAGLKA